MAIQWSCNKQPKFYLVEGRTDDEPSVMLARTISSTEWESAVDQQALFEAVIADMEVGLSVSKP